MSILDMVQQQLGGGAVEQISQQIGADPAQTRGAINMALPVLVGGLAQNAQQPEGAQALHAALDQHSNTLDQVQGFFGGGAGAGIANALGGLGGIGGHSAPADVAGGGLGGLLGGAIGGKILGHILGTRQAQAQDTIAQQSGLNQQQVGKLLMILAPIILGALARRKQQNNLDAGGVADVLRQDHQRVQQQTQGANNPLGGILGQIFGR